MTLSLGLLRRGLGDGKESVGRHHIHLALELLKAATKNASESTDCQPQKPSDGQQQSEGVCWYEPDGSKSPGRCVHESGK